MNKSFSIWEKPNKADLKAFFITSIVGFSLIYGEFSIVKQGSMQHKGKATASFLVGSGK